MNNAAKHRPGRRRDGRRRPSAADNDKPPANSGSAGIGGVTGTGGSGGGARNTIKLETWMDGIAKNGEVDVSAMPDNVLFTVTDKQPVSAAEAAAIPPKPAS